MRTVSETSGQHETHQHLNYRGSRRRREKGSEKIFEEIIVENFLNMGKEIVNQVQEVQRVSLQDKSKEKHSKAHINQTIKNYIQRKNIKSSKGKATINIQGNPHKVNSWSFSRNSAIQKGVAGHI